MGVRMSHDLKSVAATLVGDWEGNLAADETVPTLTKQFDTPGIQSTEQSRRSYREMLFTSRVWRSSSAASSCSTRLSVRKAPTAPRRPGSFEAGHPSRHQGRHRREADRRLLPAKQSPRGSTGSGIASWSAMARAPASEVAGGFHREGFGTGPFPALLSWEGNWIRA